MNSDDAAEVLTYFRSRLLQSNLSFLDEKVIGLIEDGSRVFESNSELLKAYLNMLRELLDFFSETKFQQVRHELEDRLGLKNIIVLDDRINVMNAENRRGVEFRLDGIKDVEETIVALNGIIRSIDEEPGPEDNNNSSLNFP